LDKDCETFILNNRNLEITNRLKLVVLKIYEAST
jgi:hypothetical protein